MVAAATERGRRWAALGLVLLTASGCSLDWSYPEGAAGGGGSSTGTGTGGSGACDGPRIQIVAPMNGATVPHGPVDFAAQVQCGDPPADTIVWELSGVDGVFAVGLQHVTSVDAVGTFDLWVAVTNGGNVATSDMITFSTE